VNDCPFYGECGMRVCSDGYCILDKELASHYRGNQRKEPGNNKLPGPLQLTSNPKGKTPPIVARRGRGFNA